MVDGPESLVELRDEFCSFREKMDGSLSPLERRVLALYLNGCRRKEAAQLAGMSLRQFDNALHRVRASLKRL